MQNISPFLIGLNPPANSLKRSYNQLQNCWDTPLEYDLSCFKSLLVTGLWDIILTSLLPAIQSWTSKFWVWSCIANNFDKGWRGNHRDKIMDRPFMPKYGTVSRVLWQLVVAYKIWEDIYRHQYDGSQLYWYRQKKKRQQEGHVFTEAETRY